MGPARGIPTRSERDTAPWLRDSASLATPLRTAPISMPPPTGSRFDIGRRVPRGTPRQPRPVDPPPQPSGPFVAEEGRHFVQLLNSPPRQLAQQTDQDVGRGPRVPQSPVSGLDGDAVMACDRVEAPIGKVGQKAASQAEGAKGKRCEDQTAGQRELPVQKTKVEGKVVGHQDRISEKLEKLLG